MNISLTEQGVKDLLLQTAKTAGYDYPRVIVVNRVQKQNSLTRTVRFAVIAPIDNEILINALIKSCLDNENQIYFVGSEVNLQGDLDIDYLLFEANIIYKK